MVAFKKVATLLLFARICKCDAQKEHTSTLSNNAGDELSNRNLLNLPADCSNPENYEKAQCICHDPSNAGMEICKEWFEKVSVKSERSVLSGIGTRIIGGSDVGLGEYPWFAKATNGNQWAGCGGALVSPQFVLTAAHCVVETSNSYGFEIGALCQNPFTWNPNGNCGQVSQVISSNSIIMHPDYDHDAETYDNDFALVRLNEKADATPVPMDMNGLSETYTSNNKVWTIGFGDTDPGPGDDLPSRMKHVEVSFVPDNICNNKYFGQITENMMCAADTDEDSCQGDSGGPLYDKVNSVLVGVVSWGYGCADRDYPGVYSQISSQWTWIKDTICNDSNSVKPGFCDVTPTAPTSPSPVASPPPSTSCTDTPGWYDYGGEIYTCAWYADGDNCFTDGNYYENFGQKANKACCVCGGGRSGGSYPPTRSPVTSSPTGKPVASPVANPAPTSCTDTPGWYDYDGDTYTCEWYGDVDSRCADIGNDFENFGQTANEACCVCGGGQSGGSSPTRSPVTSSPTRSPVTSSPTRSPVTANPTRSPVTSSPTGNPVPSPVANPVANPVATPTSSSLCQDVHEKFQYTSTKKKHCKYVGRFNTLVRCGKPGVEESCPVTCGTGCKCFDTPGPFIMPNGIERTCSWASSQNTEKRCRNFVVQSHCPIVCGICDA